MNWKLLKDIAIVFLLFLVHLCSTICADEEEFSTNEGEDADDDADEEEDGAE